MQFYVSNETSVKRCKESLFGQMPITISGLTSDNEIKPFIGIVVSVDKDKLTTGSKRWHITMREEPPTEK